MTPSSDLINLLEGLTELRETFSYVYQFTLKDIIKNTDEQSDGKVHRAGSGRVLSAGASVSMKLGCTSSWQVDAFTNLVAHQLLFKSFYRA